MSSSGKARLGTFSTLSIGIGGMVGGGIFAVTGITVEVTKGAAPIAFMIAGFLLLFMAVNIANVQLARDTGSRGWISALAALSTAIALIVLCIEVDENPATRYHLWILVGMILMSFGIEFAYRRITGRRLDLARQAPEGGAETAPR
jgi:uncharacterized membrane protein HdeD (DUF308 family)